MEFLLCAVLFNFRCAAFLFYQTQLTCMKIMRWSKSYPPEIMKTTSWEALDKNICSYKYFSMMLKTVAPKAAELDIAVDILD